MLKSAMVSQSQADDLPVCHRFDLDSRKEGNTIVLATALYPHVEVSLILGSKHFRMNRRRD